MKRLLLAAFLFAANALAQNPSIIPVPTAPSGSCTAPLPVYEKTPDGTLYTCQNGTWGEISGGGGTPGGSSGQIQYNNDGVFGGVSGVTSPSAGTLQFGTGAAGSSDPATIVPPGQGIWKRYGPVIMADPTFGNPWQAGEVTVFTPGSTTTNCMVVSATLYTNQCWKAYLTQGSFIMYAESLDGVHHWQFGSGNGSTCGGGTCSVVDDHDRGRVFFNPSDDKYYLYAANFANTQIDLYVSTDGLHFPTSPSYSAVATTSVCATQGWASSCSAIDNSTGIFVGSTFYMFIDFGSGSGMFTASTSAMQTLTPQGSSFAIPQGVVRYPIYTVSGQNGPCGSGAVYWTWIHEIGDNQVHRLCSTALGSGWIDALGGVADFGIQSEEEGVGLNPSEGIGQTVDPFVIAWDNKTYLYDSTAQQALSGSPPGSPDYSQVELSIADMPISSLVETLGGTEGAPEPLQVAGLLSIDYYDDAVDFNEHPITNLGGVSLSTGNLTIHEVLNSTEDIQILPASGQPLILGANGAERLRLNTSNNLYPDADNSVTLGSVGNAYANLASVITQLADATTYAGLPDGCNSTTIGQRRLISDSNSATPGAIAAGGGSITIAIECIKNSSTYSWIVD